MLPELWQFHSLHHGGCSATTYETIAHVPNNTVVMYGPGKFKIKDAVGGVKAATKEIGHSAARYRDGLHACTRLETSGSSRSNSGSSRSSSSCCSDSCCAASQYYSDLVCCSTIYDIGIY